MARIFDQVSGYVQGVAKAVMGYASTGKQTFEHEAEAVYAGMQTTINNAKKDAIDAATSIGNAVHEFGQNSPRQVVDSVKANVQKAADYVGNTPMNTMVDDGVNAVTGSAPYQNAQNGMDYLKGKGTTLLGDLDAFYHQADGSYDRTKVGLTVGAGLGIAGIAGYNMNN